MNSQTKPVFRLGIFAAKTRGKAILRAKTPSAHDFDFSRELAQQLAKRLPLLYAIVATNSLLVAWEFGATGPFFFHSVLPFAAIVICASRGWHWRPIAVSTRPNIEIVRDLKNTTLLGLIFGFITALWTIGLYDSGNNDQMDVLHFSTAVTCFVSVMALGLIPKAAAGVAITIVLPAAITFATGPHPNGIVVAALLSVTSIMVIRLSVQQRADFDELMNSKRESELRKERATRLAAEMETNALVDPLTNLPNRRAILSVLANDLKDMERPSPWLGILDLNDFKRVNDLSGHAEGDQVLIEVASRLRQTAGIRSFGRIGGDEFILILCGSLSACEATDILNELLTAVARPITTRGGIHHLTASIGLRKTERLEIGACLERADLALYEAKKAKSSVVLFSADDELMLRRRRQIKEMVRASDFEGSLDLRFQPIIDFDTKKIISFEALVRWREAGADVSTAEFVEFAELTGRMQDLARYVIKSAFETAAKWPKDVGLQINLSFRDLQSKELADILSTALARSGIDARRIVLEFTETALLTDVECGTKVLYQLKQLGFRISLDDFGTGYSSLAYLNRLPVDQIKIDREFAQSICKNATSVSIVQTVFGLCQQLSLDCILEGIETVEQALTCRRMGLRQMQGFYFAKPLTNEEIDQLARSAVSPWHLDNPPIGHATNANAANA